MFLFSFLGKIFNKKNSKLIMPNREYHIWKEKSGKERKWKSFYEMAIGYKNVFLQSLYNQINGNGSYYVEEIFPILFLFSQYLELSFKALLLRKRINFEKIHKIDKLLIEVEKEYPNFKLDDVRRKLIMDTSIINKERMNLDYEGFRYPLKRDGGRIWITKSGKDTFIDLAGVSSTTGDIINYLDSFFKKII